MTDVAPARKGPPPRTPGVPAEVSFEAHYRRDTFAGGTPVSGFGPRGTYTLYLPPHRPEPRVVFRDGLPHVHELPAAGDVPEVREARDAVLASWAEGSASLSVIVPAVAFHAYTAAIIRVNYDLGDEELTLLLSHGTRWHADVLRHLIGGERFIETLAAYHRLRSPAPAPPAAPPARDRAPSRWTRLRRAFRIG
jgi:hypothetical protein